MNNPFKRALDRVQQATDAIANAWYGNGVSIRLSETAQNPPADFKVAEIAYTANSDETATQGTTWRGTYIPSPSTYAQNKGFVLPQSRRDVFKEIDQLCNDDPYISNGLWLLFQGSIGAGFNFSFKWKDGETTVWRAKAKAALEKARELILPDLGQWAIDWGKYGDAYIELVADKQGKLHSFQSLHTATIERLSDLSDKFEDPKKAFRQVDPANVQAHTYLSLYQLVHGRFNKPTGSPYGQSILFPARKSLHDLIAGYATLLKRRKRSLPIPTYETKDADSNALVGPALERFKNGEPGKPWEALPEIRAQQGDTDAVEGEFTYRLLNGNSTFRLEQPNITFSDVGDLEALLDRALASIFVPRGLIKGDVVNFATLDALLKQLYAVQRIITRYFEHQILRPLFERVLLLEGIPVKYLEPEDAITYEIDWAEKFTHTEMVETAGILVPATQNGLYPKRACLEHLARLAGRTDVDALQKMLDEQNGQVNTLENIANKTIVEGEDKTRAEMVQMLEMLETNAKKLKAVA